MKKTILLLAALFTGFLMQAQMDGFNFKGLLTNGGNPVANQTIDVKAIIYENNIVKWREKHSNVQTDQNGIFSIVIGSGVREAGVATFNDIDWSNPNLDYRITVDMGSGYVVLVNHEPFQGVPYAKMAENVGELKKLGVGDSPNSSEIVRFRNDNPINEDDVLDLEMNNAPASGIAQFIECTLGGTKVFKIQHNGSIITEGNIYVKGELHSEDSGFADMKAYIYGSVDATGNLHTSASSNGFSVTKIGAGQYQVAFTNSPGGTYNYIVIATPGSSTHNIGVGRYNNFFKIYTRQISTNIYDDISFSFVVFKK